MQKDDHLQIRKLSQTSDFSVSGAAFLWNKSSFSLTVSRLTRESGFVVQLILIVRLIVTVLGDGCALVLGKRGKLYWFWSNLIFVSSRRFTLCLGTFLMALTASAERCQRLFGRLDEGGGAWWGGDGKDEEGRQLKAKGGGYLCSSAPAGDNCFSLGINSVCLQTISPSFTWKITCVSPINTHQRYNGWISIMGKARLECEHTANVNMFSSLIQLEPINGPSCLQTSAKWKTIPNIIPPTLLFTIVVECS